jgi:hypothetical protein
MIHSNIPKRPTLLAATGLAVALLLGFALNPTPAFAAKAAKPCDPWPACKDDGATTYTAALADGAFVFAPVDVTPDAKENELRSVDALTFVRPGEITEIPYSGSCGVLPELDEALCLAWDAVFLACENFFGDSALQSIGLQIPDEFTVSPDDWAISKS